MAKEGYGGGSQPTGIEVWVTPGSASQSIVIQRAPDSGGSPGTYADLTTLAASPADQGYFDALPVDGTYYWYRAFHRASGYNDGTPTSGIKRMAADPNAL